MAALADAARVTPLQVSGVSGEGVTELLRAALARIRPLRGDDDPAEAADAPWRP